MKRRNFLRFSVFSFLALGFEKAKPLSPLAASEGIRTPAPVKPWEKVDFSYTSGSQTYPGVAVRLPKITGGAGGERGEIYAACRICPHQGCQFNYEMDFGKIGDMVGATLENPVFFCRCHMSIFDPAQKGKVLFGPANRPPWVFSIRIEKNEMVITGVEEGAGQIG